MPISDEKFTEAVKEYLAKITMQEIRIKELEREVKLGEAEIERLNSIIDDMQYSADMKGD